MASPGKSPAWICSSALAKVGAGPIVSLSDSSNRAVLCNRLWPTTRDAVLSSKNWGVAFERATLVKDATAPTYDFTARFRLPEDLMLLLDTDLPEYSKYQIEGDFLVCDFDNVKILYIKQTTDSATYGPLLTDALIAAMAAELAFPITSDLVTKAAMEKERDQKLGIAAAREAQQRSKQSLSANILVQVRR